MKRTISLTSLAAGLAVATAPFVTGAEIDDKVTAALADRHSYGSRHGTRRQSQTP